MPRKKLTHPFQLELLRQQKDKDRIVRELKLRQRIYTFAELSEKERKSRFAFLIAEKVVVVSQTSSSFLFVKEDAAHPKFFFQFLLIKDERARAIRELSERVLCPFLRPSRASYVIRIATSTTTFARRCYWRRRCGELMFAI